MITTLIWLLAILFGGVILGVILASIAIGLWRGLVGPRRYVRDPLLPPWWRDTHHRS